MKYKTLFRLAVKVLGLWLIVQWLVSVLPVLVTFAVLAITGRATALQSVLSLQLDDLMVWLPSLLSLAIGFYLFFGGKWIASMAIPSNKQYCHECGYMLKNLTGNRCPECDTPFKPDAPATS